MFKPKSRYTPIVSDSHDWYVKVPEDESLNRILANRKQCRAYKGFIETLGLAASIYKREYSGKKSEGGFIQSERLMER